MANVFVFKPVVPKLYNVAKVRQSIMKALDTEGKHTIPYLNVTVSTWNGKPTMGYKVEMKGNHAVMEAKPQGTGKDVLKWWWLAYGTQVRYARLSRDWKSKTRVGVLRPGPGQGRVVLRGRRAGAHRGIDARNWVQIIEKMRRRPFFDAMTRAIRNGLKP